MQPDGVLTTAALTRSNWRVIVDAGDGAYHDYWSALSTAARDTDDPEVALVLSLFARLCSMVVRSTDWANPYVPMFSMNGRRAMIPDDLTDDERTFLVSAVGGLDDPKLRARVADVLWLQVPAADRFPYALAHLDAWLELEVTEQTWSEDHEGWGRAALVARRHGKATRPRLQKVERRLLGAFKEIDSNYVPLQLANTLREHGLAGKHAAEIAARLASLADRHKDSDRSRSYRAAAADWYTAAGQPEARWQQTLLSIRSWISEAQTLEADPTPNSMRAAGHYENALQFLRQIPKSVRVDLAVEGLAAELAAKIRQVGAASLSEMHAFTSKSVSLTKAAKQAVEQVQGKELMPALSAFAGLMGFASAADEEKSAATLIKQFPLRSLFSNVHYASDGRVVFRSGGQGSPKIYGVDVALWQQMIQSYELRISLAVSGMFWPAFVQLTNEHRLSERDFAIIARDSQIVPKDRSGQYARALYAGYNGDFSTATQLLVPQIENLVRHHLREAGINTSTLKDGLEYENGLSALMELDIVNQIFTPDLAFEIRALFCGPLGPNLRNEIAHGLLSDGSASSASTMYAWWFGFRLAFVAYWNRLHDNDAAVANEPGTPSDA